MLFNSLEFAIFFPVVFCIYWSLRKWRSAQNFFILISSCFFYGFWDARFLILILISSLTDYILGLKIFQSEDPLRRRLYLWLSLGINLGMLGYFKYANFFIESFNDSFQLFGSSFRLNTLSVILPLGISFYTFQTLSYSIDIYKKKLVPITDITAFFSFVTFFPQLVAGPIERARHFLPQLQKSRKFNYTVALDGLLQLTWGLVKKVLIADNLAATVNVVFDSPESHSGSTLLIGSVFFYVQLYCDFSGYSDMAIGMAKILGFKLSKNFSYPIFSRSFAEFWRRWHITMTNWFRDYLYIPLVLGRNTLMNKIIFTYVLFVVIGLWHGASYSFLVFGFVCGFYYMFDHIKVKKWKHEIIGGQKLFPSGKEFRHLVYSGLKILSGLICFRSKSVRGIYDFHTGVFSQDLFSIPAVDFELIILVSGFIIVEWLGRNYSYPPEVIHKKLHPYFVYLVIIAFFLAITLFNNSGNLEYIYFQF